jgi:hypothetical protein
MPTTNKQTVLFAQPYDISAVGFYFASVEDYEKQSARLRNSFGQPVEEFEIQFIDGDELDAELFKAVGVNQGNFGAFLDACNYWNTDQKRNVIIAVGECGYTFDLKNGNPDDLDVEIYELNSLRELAHYFVDEEIMFGKVPESIKYHLDYDSIARDLGMDYCEIVIAGTSLVYRCG